MTVSTKTDTKQMEVARITGRLPAQTAVLAQETGPNQQGRFRKLRSFFTNHVTIISFVALLLTAGSICKAASGVALMLDGCFQLMCLIENHRPIAYHDRFGLVLPQLPVAWVFNLTDQLGPTLATFCTTYALVPLLPICLAWLFVRKHKPAMFVWPAIALCLTSLCGQVMLVNGSMFVFLFVWPLYVGALGTMSSGRVAALFALSCFIVSLHLSGAVYVGLTAGAVFVRWFVERRRSAKPSERADTADTANPAENSVSVGRPARQDTYLGVLALLLVSVVLAKVAMFLFHPASYDLNQMAKESNPAYLGIIFYGPLVPAAVLSIVSGLTLLLSKWFFRKLFLTLAFATAIASCLLSAWWSANLGVWTQGLTFCRLMPVFFAPLMLFALIDALTDQDGISSRRTLGAARTWMVVTTAVSFCFIACVQSFYWSALTDYMKGAMERYPTAYLTQLDLGIDRIELVNDWSVTALSIVLQGRRHPQHVVLFSNIARKAFGTGKIRVVPWERPGTHHWFRFPQVKGNFRISRTAH